MGDNLLPGNNLDWPLLERYLSGQACPEEKAYVEAYLAEYPDSATVLTGLKHEVGVAGQYPTTGDAIRAYESLSERLGLARRSFVPSVRTREARPAQSVYVRHSRFLAIAAGLLVVVGGGLGYSRFPQLQWSSKQLEQRSFSTERGQRASIELADGSRVMLAADSRISYPRDFTSHREVVLTGEAVFTVVPNSEHPFVVRAGRSVNKVLGTTFSARAYDSDNTARIIVADGRVAVNGVVVSQNELAVVGDGGEAVVQHVNADEQMSWVNGAFERRNARLGDVIADLERWYDVRISLADSRLAKRLVTLSIAQEDPVTALHIVARAAGARMKQSGDSLTLYVGG